MSIYCIGDVHGCYDTLQKLLEIIDFSLNTDELWFTGDLVNRGNASLEVLRFIKKLPKKVVVLGNHDLHLLALHNGFTHPASHSLDNIFQAKDRHELLDWLRLQPLLHYAKNENWVLSHAGIYPLWNINQAERYANEIENIKQDFNNAKHFFIKMYGDIPTLWQNDLQELDRYRFIINAFTRMRFCDKNGSLEFTNQGKIGSQPLHLMPWYELPTRVDISQRILFGHWAALNWHTEIIDEVKDNVFALDTGCAWGRYLTAKRLDDGKIFRCNFIQTDKKT